MKRDAGFTLTELLVVIAVIAVLAAILFPVFARARSRARQTTCLSNMRQIGTAMQLYLQEYDDVLMPVWTEGAPPFWPPTESVSSSQLVSVPWTGLLQPYLTSQAVLYCPAFDEGLLEETAARPTCDGPWIQSLFPAR